eukprot:scaffold2507_cov257-Ochromonas_danica.AAC.33
MSWTAEDVDIDILEEILSSRDDSVELLTDESTHHAVVVPTKAKTKKALRKEQSLIRREKRKQLKAYLAERYRCTFTRILKQDFRRQFADMHSNTMNSLSMINCMPVYFGRPSTSIYGRDNIAELMSLANRDKPDAVGKRISCRIIRRLNEEGCEVEILSHFTCTKIIHNAPDDSSTSSSENEIVPVTIVKWEFNIHNKYFLNGNNFVYKLITSIQPSS